MNFYEIQKTKSGTESALHKKSDIYTLNGDKVRDDDAISTKSDIDDGINIVFNYDYNCTPNGRDSFLLMEKMPIFRYQLGMCSILFIENAQRDSTESIPLRAMISYRKLAVFILIFFYLYDWRKHNSVYIYLWLR